MDKLFIYEVNGVHIEDNEAFGKGWREAKEVAIANHTYIARQVIKGENISNEIFAVGGFFLPEDRCEKDEVKIF